MAMLLILSVDVYMTRCALLIHLGLIGADIRITVSTITNIFKHFAVDMQVKAKPLLLVHYNLHSCSGCLDYTSDAAKRKNRYLDAIGSQMMLTNYPKTKKGTLGFESIV